MLLLEIFLSLSTRDNYKDFSTDVERLSEQELLREKMETPEGSDSLTFPK